MISWPATPFPREPEPLFWVGDIVHGYGEVSAIGTVDGERYYWMVNKAGTVSMIPADVVEARKPQTVEGPQ